MISLYFERQPSLKLVVSKPAMKAGFDLLWFSRNKACHEGTIPDFSKLASSIKKTTLAHAAAWKSSSGLKVEAWAPPHKGSIKINLDTAIRDQFIAQAVVCRDHKGTIKAISHISYPCNPNFGEALATLLAASLVVSLKLKKFIIEEDSLIAITALQHPLKRTHL